MFQNHRLAISSRTSSSFPNNSSHLLLCPYLSSLLPRSGRPCHKLSSNRYIPSLSFSSFFLLPEEASYLCISGTQYSLNPFCILSTLLVIFLPSLENHRFRQFPCQWYICNGAAVACFTSPSFIFPYKYCGISPSRQALKHNTRFLCKLLKFSSQNPWAPSGPGAFQFRMFFNIFFSF